MASSTSIDVTRKVKSVLEGSTKGDAKASFHKGLANMGIAVIGGGLVTAIIGKPSFLLGAGLTVYGYYKDNHWLAPLGLGMMASSSLVPNESSTGVSGFDLKQETENAKTRLMSFKDSLLSKTYLDKVIKPKPATNSSTNRTIEAPTTEETTSGFGSVQDNLNVLNNIEHQLINSAMAIQNQNKSESTQGFNDEVNGIDEQDFSTI